MPSLRRQEGYLMVDHRASPGIPRELAETWARQTGQEIPTGGLWESATATCCHCNAQVVLNPGRTRARGYCAKCDHYVCDGVACNAGCTPFAQVLDDAEKAIRHGGLILPDGVRP